MLVGERGAYRQVQSLPAIQVPVTVQAVLAARIDRLPSDEKRLLQTAAAVGTEAPFPLLQAVPDAPEADPRPGLTSAGGDSLHGAPFPEWNTLQARASIRWPTRASAGATARAHKRHQEELEGRAASPREHVDRRRPPA